MEDLQKTCFAKPRLLPGVKPEMFCAGYWTQDDSILMKEEEIRLFNKRILEDETKACFCVMTGDLPDAKARERFVLYNLERQKDFDGIDDISNHIRTGLRDFGEDCRFGVCVKRTVMLSLPVGGPWPFYKPFSLAPLHMAQPVIIYSVTDDGKWYFVRSELYYGWVASDCVALVRERDQLEEFSIHHKDIKKDFLVVTGNSLEIPSEDGLKVYDMGDRIRILHANPELHRYELSIPARDSSGKLVFATAHLSAQGDISAGYLPYTRRYLLEQCFKCTDSPYYWGGARGGRDCSSFIVELYACFGISMPRNAGRQSQIPVFHIDLNQASVRQKAAAIESLPPGVLLFSPGHVMVNLGLREQEHLVFNTAGDFRISGEEEAFYGYGTTINSLDRTYTFSGRSWLDNITSVVFPYIDSLHGIVVK